MKIAVYYKDEKWYWLDLMWGESGKNGSGWLCVLPLGVGRRLARNFFPGGDNREQIDPQDIRRMLVLEKINIPCCKKNCEENSEVMAIEKGKHPADAVSYYCLKHSSEFSKDDNYILQPATIECDEKYIRKENGE